MSSQPKVRLTPEEYLTIERKAECKSEYHAGQMFAMSGASEAHNLIAGNVFAAFHAQLRNRPCKVYPSDMRVKIGFTGLYTYPDVTVVCGEVHFDDEQRDTLLNPTVIIEVLSPSTEGYDRGAKCGHYRKLESLQEYVLIAQDKHHVEHYVRQPDDQWLLSETGNLQDTINLPSINCDLALEDVYEKVEIEMTA
jgi:Uma2 family endonuclease